MVFLRREIEFQNFNAWMILDDSPQKLITKLFYCRDRHTLHFLGLPNMLLDSFVGAAMFSLTISVAMNISLLKQQQRKACTAPKEPTPNPPTVNKSATQSRKAPQPMQGMKPPSSFSFTPIGTLSTPFPLCVGTPRQSSLCPSITSTLNLDQSRVGPGIVDGLEKFQWVWVIFVFHENNNWDKIEAVNGAAANETATYHQFPSKIAPPSLGGKKVGILGTRSPHRPNQIGISLLKLEEIVLPTKKNNKKFSLILSGADLVDGTPILDVKPFVPHYDSVGFYEYRSALRYVRGMEKPHVTMPIDDVGRHGSSLELGEDRLECPLPDWLAVGLTRRRKIRWELEGEGDVLETLGRLLKTCKKSHFYKKDPIKYKKMVEEVLAVDVRSKFQTAKLRSGGFQVKGKENRGKICQQILDGLVLEFEVIENDTRSGEGEGEGEEAEVAGLGKERGVYSHQESAKGSGCDDIVIIRRIDYHQ